MKNESRLVKEFRVATPVKRAGFVPAPFEPDGEDVETWQVWCKSVENQEERRATYGDMTKAGFRKAKKK